MSSRKMALNVETSHVQHNSSNYLLSGSDQNHSTASCNLNNNNHGRGSGRGSSRRRKRKGITETEMKTSPYNLLKLLNELPTINNHNNKSAKSSSHRQTPYKSSVRTPTAPGEMDYYDRIPKTLRTPAFNNHIPNKPTTPRSRPETTDRKTKSKYSNYRSSNNNGRYNSNYVESSRRGSNNRYERRDDLKSSRSTRAGDQSSRYQSKSTLSNYEASPKVKSDQAIHSRYIKLPPITRSQNYSTLKRHKQAANDFLSVLKSNYPRYTKHFGKLAAANSNSNLASRSGSRPVTKSRSNLSRSRSVASVSEHIHRHNFARLNLSSRSRSVSDVRARRSQSQPRQGQPLWTARSVIRATPRSSSYDPKSSRSRPRTRDKSSRPPPRSRSTSIVDARRAETQRKAALRRQQEQQKRSRSVSNTRFLRSKSKGGNVEIKQTRTSLARSQSLIAIAMQQKKHRNPPPPSRSSRTRDRSYSQYQRDQDRSRSKMRKTPSLPELHRSISRNSLTSRVDEPQKKKLTPLFIAIKPENQGAEKDKFMKYPNFMYSPQFRYANPPSDTQLQKFSRASDKYLTLAIKIMNNAINKFGTYERYMEETGGRKLSRLEITQAAKAYLQRENLESEVDIHLADDLLSRARMAVVGGRPTVIIRAVNMRENWVEGMLRHEIGTHYLRAWNNKLQKWGKNKTRQELSLEPANPTEEGLASLHSVLFRKDPCLWRGALLYYTIYKASQMSFAEVFRDLGQFVKDTEVRWEYCIRAKRGYTDTSQPGAFCKDQVYLNGALQILKHRNDIDFPMLVKCGKVSWRDLGKLEQLEPDLEQTRIPKFMHDLNTYKAELTRILVQNGITEEDMELI